MKCWMDSGWVSSPRLDSATGTEDWGHRLRSKWPTSNTIWLGSAACAQPWRQLRPPCFVWNKLTPEMNRAETDTRHVWGNEAWQHHRVNHASVYQGISQINWTLWQFANNNETETRTQQQLNAGKNFWIIFPLNILWWSTLKYCWAYCVLL